MKLFLALLLLACGCQTNEPAKAKAQPAPGSAAPVGGPVVVADPSAYASDIAKLCDSVRLSGADQVPEAERNYPIANWLSANLATKESREFLVKIQPLVGEPKAAALEGEARRVGLASCALAAEWRAAR